MEQRITHACGHEQAHHLTGFASQQERKARWLQTTNCRTCFVAVKRSEQAEVGARADAAIAHLALPELAGSERQVSWATTIRAARLAALIASPAADGDYQQALLAVTDAKWWIDNRDLKDTDLLARARFDTGAADSVIDGGPIKSIARAA